MSSTTFSFVPRKLAPKPPKTTPTPTHQSNINANSNAVNAVSSVSVTPTPVASSAGVEIPSKRNELKLSEADYVALVCLAFSEYALWKNPDLRRAIDYSNEGFISLGTLLDSCTCPTLSGLGLQVSGVAIIKALRNLATHLFDVRILLRSESTLSRGWMDPSGPGYTSTTANSTSTSTELYEIRKTDWNGGSSPSLPKSKFEWDRLTVYVENLPTNYRTIPGILRCIQGLLRGKSGVVVQGITLPAHHQDKPGTQPSCKGFALVTLSTLEDAEYLLKMWPWERTANRDHGDGDGNAKAKGKGKAGTLAGDSDMISEATKFGLRFISKQKWEQLRDEYLVYRQKLVDEINAFQDVHRGDERDHGLGAGAVNAELSKTKGKLEKLERLEKQQQQQQARLEDPHPDTSNAPTLSWSSPYPPSCLVFVRHVHHETNKTTLRSLFTKTLKSLETEGSDHSNSNILDYVDYNKGMDSCHLRFSTPHPARVLVDHFIANPTSQSTGLDEVGVPGGKAANNAVMPMKLEVVTGKREELYWEKVPEKIRRQAVQKAIEGVERVRGDVDKDNKDQSVGGTRKRKRRK